MKPADKDFLRQLVETPSPTGKCAAIQRVIQKRLQKIAASTETDMHGNLIVGINTNARRRVMLEAHVDQIGFLVRRITPEGFLLVDALGGPDEATMAGHDVVVYTEKGEICGVLGKKATHLEKGSEMSNRPTVKEVWVDIGAKDGEQASKYVRPGDYITYNLQMKEMVNGLFAGTALDDKAGILTIVQAFEEIARRKPDTAVYAAFTVQEEIGMRGAATAAHALGPEVGIAVDVGNATDDPSAKSSATPMKLGGGPAMVIGPNANPALGRLMAKAADDSQIPWQPEPMGKTASNDADAIQTARKGGVATASISIPLRYMHTPMEVCAWEDIEHTTRLLVESVMALRNDTELRPLYSDPSGAD